jgi:hypothetical protein
MAKTPSERKARPKKETPDSFPVVHPGQLPYQSTSQRTRQVHVLQSSRQVSIDHVAIRATQYEFYFPIAVWHLDVTRTFLANLSQFAGGATIFKGATGVWREEKKDEGQEDRTVEEDVYIYRLIVNAEQFNPDANHPGLHSRVADYVADLSVCHFILQKEFLFTESSIIMDRSFLVIPGTP